MKAKFAESPKGEVHADEDRGGHADDDHQDHGGHGHDEEPGSHRP
jgi:hypothetical protein